MSPYLSYFGLSREPFTIAPDPSLLYPSNTHREAVAHLRYGLEREGGFILLTGEVGTGKTTLTRMLLATLPAEVRVAYLLHSQLAADDLLAALLQELDIALPAVGPVSFSKQCIDLLYQNLLAAHADGRRTLVVIEEAQNLPTELLEMLRLLSNLETDRSKLLHILLVGQPELLDSLARRELRQLNQRVVSRFHLQPLAAADIEAYLEHRLRAVGAQRKLFANGAAAALAKLSGGIPRRLNLIAQQALIAAYASGADQVSAKLVRAAAPEVLGEPTAKPRRAGWLVIAGALLLVALSAQPSWRELLVAVWQPQPLPAAPLPALPSSYRQPLQPGDSDKPLVNWLVAQLTRHGLLEAGYISGGHYAPPLAAAVVDWQRLNGLPANGVLDLPTVRSLQRAVPVEGAK